ncbi:MAG: PEGA domain-containing protein, partial [Methanoregula sp.]|nr:PEGA domain-containing protein [Methanoregula sp.]
VLLIIPGAMAFEVTTASVNPDIMSPGDPVNVSCTVYAASGTAFSSYDDLQFVTGLDDPVWSYTILVNEGENIRPNDRGKILTIGGYELSYRDQDEVIAKISLKGYVPATAPMGANISVLKIQELNARGNVISSSVIDISHRVGLPTPTPTPEYGRVEVMSEPSGANVYLDNIIRGITPVTVKVVPNGYHTILLRLDGYEDYTEEVVVTADDPQVNAVLVSKSGSAVSTSSQASETTTIAGTNPATTQPATQAGTGSLSITTSPSGALVYIDGKMKGITPATVPGLAPGTHSIKLILDGYQDLETTTEITAGSTSEFITGLSKRKQLPGFTGMAALAAVGLLLVVRETHKEKP